ncbi:hypothetical protein GPS59_12790 [Acinetobacter haemolyticus]|uniref:hypothetical protein n=1 Tax=Acinetobacter haemolyticus TaxID=29430 RepID=UPI0002D0A35E|nr:hypothetical protein [Acinetobacter haemolyticus]ENW20965.1 hypothetical protein F926_01740 [Acinetobacter haemolyticus NIPH 261]NAR54852.1 hypothetical protein [Acinetobacter haemolyticus]QHI29024.1 hypothetical protein AhaeINNSZ174_05850 [Acinetobacter haemolyticus]
MARLDVSDVLLDPDFMDTEIVCNRTAVIVGNNGRSQETVTSSTFSGVVTTNNGLNMDRRSDGTLIKGAINIHTKFALSSGNSETKADEIVWRGKTYIVTQVLDNLHYGQGFVKAICELKPLG